MPVLRDVLRDLPVRRLAGADDVQVTDVDDDSRRITPGGLFIARAGRDADGHRYVDSAVRRGAVAVLAEREIDAPPGVTVAVADQAGPLMAAIADRVLGRPPAELRLVGITGTNGKTTTAFLVRHLLAAAGVRCGLVGTVEVDDGESVRPATLTTPGLFEVRKLLRAMADHGCGACVMEASSHALDQGRLLDLDFDVAVFTNLSGEHIDYHGTLERYAAAKARLFESLSSEAVAIVNGDDEMTRRMLRDCPARARRWTTADPPAADTDCQGAVTEAAATGTTCRLLGPWGSVEVNAPLIGRHNVANLLAAVAVGHELGASRAALAEGAATCPPVPGRLELIQPTGPDTLPFTVLVDYAHTDDALRNVMEALRPITRGRLRVMFGCGGDRDATKRPRMGAVASELADDAVITSDNPRTEDPNGIIDDILTGIPEADRQRVIVEPDRRRAIERIIADAEPNDVVLLAGKGHENYQIVGSERRSFDDRIEARRTMEALIGKSRPHGARLRP